MIERELLTAAIRIAADASRTSHHDGHNHQRTLVKRKYVAELRSALDRAGYGDDWRTLHDLVRVEERQPDQVAL